MVLSEKQRLDVNRAVLDYLIDAGLSESATSFAAEVGIEAADLDDKSRGLLEKKWTSVVRLQKKVLELEGQLKDAQTQIAQPHSFGQVKDSTLWIPRPPQAHDLTGHRMPITSVKFHPLFSACCTASEDATIKVWDTESGDLEKTLKGHTAAVNDIDFDEKGKTLASCSTDMTIRLWDFEKFVCTKTLRGHEHNVSSVQFFGSDNLVSASRDKTIRIWELSTGFCTSTLTGHSDWVRKARISNCGAFMASVSNDQSVRVWNVKTRDIRHVLNDHDHVVEFVAFAPDSTKGAINRGLMGAEGVSAGPFFATGSRDRSIKVWDASTGQLLHSFTGHESWVRGLVFHPGGKYLLSCCDDKTVKVWDLEAKRCLKTLPAHRHFVQSIDIHPKSRFVATASVDNSARLWSCS